METAARQPLQGIKNQAEEPLQKVVPDQNHICKIYFKGKIALPFIFSCMAFWSGCPEGDLKKLNKVHIAASAAGNLF